jgi:transcriptional regulator of NAD metabolism
MYNNGGHSYSVSSSGTHNHVLQERRRSDNSGTGTQEFVHSNGTIHTFGTSTASVNMGVCVGIQSSGSHSHPLSTDGDHNHTIMSTGGSEAHNHSNDFTFINVCVWRRVS